MLSTARPTYPLVPCLPVMAGSAEAVLWVILAIELAAIAVCIVSTAYNRASPYSEDVARSCVSAYEELNLTLQEVSEVFGPCTKTISVWVQRARAGAARLSAHGRQGVMHCNRLLTPAAAELLIKLVTWDEVADLAELATAMTEATGRACSRNAACKALHSLGYARVRITSQAAEQDPSQVAGYRMMFQLRGFTKDQLVFIDETSTVSTQRIFAPD